MKKGFTLVELLAVIVILVIIAMISVPIVINIINDSKTKTEEQSIEIYGRIIENAVANYFTKYPEKNKVTLEELEKENLINYNDRDIKCDTVQVKDRKVYLDKCTIDGKKVNYTYGKILIPGILLEDVEPIGLSPGDKYAYKVNDTDTFNFYVLSLNEDGTINLIMDRSICEDGTVSYTLKNNYCNYRWNEQDHNNNYGPEVAMTKLYNATKNWTNVPDMVMNYTDENNHESGNINGYEGIITDTNTKLTKIIGKNGATSTIIGASKKPLKARLPKEIEVAGTGCTESYGSCLTWLIGNLHNYSKGVKVGDKFIQHGDANGDGYITNEDVKIIQSYLAGYDVSIIEKTADVDLDGEIAINDTVDISQFFSNYDNCIMKKYIKFSDDAVHIQEEIYGYWLLSSFPGYLTYSSTITFYGSLSYKAGNIIANSIRPVITVSRDYLTN